MPITARTDDDALPARSVIITPHTELADMFLIEAERVLRESAPTA